MSISLEALEAAFSEIEHLGHDEIDFKVGETTLWMGTISPEEELLVQQYAAQAWTEDDENSTGETMAYVDRFRVDTLARAIVQVGELDLRGVEFIETGEALPNGKSIKEARHKVLRTMVLKWGGPVRLAVFRKYTELLKKVEKKAEGAIEYEPSDAQAEIERLEARVAELKEELEAKNEGPSKNPAYAVAEFSDADSKVRHDALSKKLGDVIDEEAGVAPAEGPAPKEAVPIQPRRSIIPEAAPPPPQQASVQQQAPAAQPPTRSAPVTDGGSFVGGDEMADAVEEANQRLFAARAAAGGPAHPPAESALMAVHEAARRPPHAAAAEAAAEIEGEERARLRGHTEEGTEVFSLPSQVVDLTPRGGAPMPVPGAAAPSKGTHNPRFRPPGR